MNNPIAHFARITVLAASLGAAGLLPSLAQAGEEAIEGVPEITQLGPEGKPAHPVVRDGEDMRHIAEAGPQGRPAPVVIRDGEGSPTIDRLGPELRAPQRSTVAGHSNAGGTL